jgi:hypothetical protein
MPVRCAFEACSLVDVDRLLAQVLGLVNSSVGLKIAVQSAVSQYCHVGWECFLTGYRKALGCMQLGIAQQISITISLSFLLHLSNSFPCNYNQKTSDHHYPFVALRVSFKKPARTDHKVRFQYHFVLGVHGSQWTFCILTRLLPCHLFYAAKHCSAVPNVFRKLIFP